MRSHLLKASAIAAICAAAIGIVGVGTAQAAATDHRAAAATRLAQDGAQLHGALLELLAQGDRNEAIRHLRLAADLNLANAHLLVKELERPTGEPDGPPWRRRPLVGFDGGVGATATIADVREVLEDPEPRDRRERYRHVFVVMYRDGRFAERGMPRGVFPTRAEAEAEAARSGGSRTRPSPSDANRGVAEPTPTVTTGGRSHQRRLRLRRTARPDRNPGTAPRRPPTRRSPDLGLLSA